MSPLEQTPEEFDAIRALLLRYESAEVMALSSLTGTRVTVPAEIVALWPLQVDASIAQPLDLLDDRSRSIMFAASERARRLGAAEAIVEDHFGNQIALGVIRSLHFGVDLFLFQECPSFQTIADDQNDPRPRIQARIETTIDGAITDIDNRAAPFFSHLAEGTNVTQPGDLHPASQYAVTDAWTRVAEGRSDFERVRLRFDNEEERLYADLDVYPETHNGETKIVVDALDVTADVEVLDALRRSEEQFRTLAETLPVGVFVVGPFGALTYSNGHLRDIMGIAEGDEFGWLDRFHSDDRERLEAEIVDLPTTHRIDVEVRVLGADGSVRWCRMAARDLRGENGELESVVGLLEDVTEMRSLQNRLERQARLDSLTTLPNRATLLHHLSAALDRTAESADHLAVLFVDLDGFKLVNDTQGHSVGDLLLQSVAQRFRTTMRPGDVVARFGGDEFIVVAESLTSPDDAMAIAARLHETLAEPIIVHGQAIRTSASVGVAMAGHLPSSGDQLVGDADLAMYEAKRLGRNRTVLYDVSLRQRAAQRFDITTDLQHARARDELRLEYQPLFDLGAHRVIGVEALIRWDHPSHGRLMPGSFIQLAEENGLILDIGDWVIEQACADLAKLRHQGVVDDDFIISVNVSTAQLTALNDLITTSEIAIDCQGLKNSDLIFELTESIPIDAIPEAAGRIEQLTDKGFGLAIDDFGTGYSSLEYLTSLPFSILKLDPSFTSRLTEADAASAVLESLVSMSTRIGFSIIAEGIETSEQLDLLRASGVRRGQGHMLARPQPLAKLRDSLIAVNSISV